MGLSIFTLTLVVFGKAKDIEKNQQEAAIVIAGHEILPFFLFLR
jgi:hypothetical protein